VRWKNPRALAKSVLINEASTALGTLHSIGHTAVELQCEAGPDGGAFYSATGMTNIADGTERKLLLQDQIGLSILFYDFEGEFEKGERVLRNLVRNYERRAVHFVEFLISASTCQRLARYVTEFEERGYWRRYGLPNRPRQGEGAGCSAYAASFAEVGGFLLPEFEVGWSRFRRVPLRTLGGELNPGNRVNLLELASAPRSRWAKKEEAHRELFFWDPDRMYQWVRETHRELARGRADLGFPVTLKRARKAFGLEIDMRSVPTPEEPIWLSQ
jgi:hypothetical protein